MRRLLLFFLAIVAAAFAQGLEKRVVPIEVSHRLALVIGNTAYKYLQPIPPARNDAEDMASVLRRLGFTVTVRNDVGLVELIHAIGAFRATIQSGDLAFVYYSGHGGQLDEENYLLPVDYEPPVRVDADLVPRRAYKMSELRDRIEASGARVRVFIFDACRSSPLLTTKESAKDYAPVSGQPEGTVIAFASAHLQPAGFAPGNRNSDYTQELLGAFRQPRLPDLEALLIEVRGRVFQRTNRTQTPYLYGFLSGPLYLTGAPSVIPSPPPPSVPVSTEATSLVIAVDADATVVIDDQAGFSVKAGQLKRFAVVPGTHFLAATSGATVVRKTVEVRRGEQQAVQIDLAVLAEDQRLEALVGMWTGTREDEGKFANENHSRYHLTTTGRVRLQRPPGSREIVATFHEEGTLKGLDDPKSPSDNFIRTFDAEFHLKLTGSSLTGAATSAAVQYNPGGHEAYANVAFAGTLIDRDHLKFEIVWQRHADGTILNRSNGTLLKQ